MLSFLVWDSPRHGNIPTAIPAGIHVQMGVGLRGHLVHISTHVCSCVYDWVWPPTRGLLSLGMCGPALVGAGLSSGRDTEEEKHLAVCAQGL